MRPGSIDSPVGIETTDWTIRGSIPSRIKILYGPQNIKTVSEVHPASHPVFISRGKAAGE
jgi:hypothetical protein